MIIHSTHPLHPDVTARLAAMADYRVSTAPAATKDEARDAHLLIVRAPIPPDYFAAAPQLIAALRHGAGLDMIPVDAATAAGVLVTNVPGANAGTVAEHVIFAAIALLRRFPQVNTTLRSAGWNAARPLSDLGRDLGPRRLGIYGFGNIGRALHRIAQGFGMTVAAHTRRPDSLPPDVQPLSLDTLCATSDVLVLCCPLTPATAGSITAARIAAMKPGAVLINVARGPVVDTAALTTALQSGTLSAALDVFDTQPLPETSPLWHLPNVILTPHMAGITDDSMARMGHTVADQIERILAGRLPQHLCNPQVSPRIPMTP